MVSRSEAEYLGAPDGPGAVKPKVRIPPVEVPTMKSKSSAHDRPVRCSISTRMRAGMMPRIPPPSTERTLIGQSQVWPSDLQLASLTLRVQPPQTPLGDGRVHRVPEVHLRDPRVDWMVDWSSRSIPSPALGP